MNAKVMDTTEVLVEKNERVDGERHITIRACTVTNSETRETITTLAGSLAVFKALPRHESNR